MALTNPTSKLGQNHRTPKTKACSANGVPLWYRNFILILLFIATNLVVPTYAKSASNESTQTNGPDINPDKVILVKELMEVTGANASSHQFSDSLSQQFVSVLKLANPNLSDRAISIVNEEVTRMVETEFASGSLQRRIYKIYSDTFTLQELDQLITFHKSPVGQKANRLIPELMRQSLLAAESWSLELGPKISQQVLRRFDEEGISVKTKIPRS